MSRLSQRLGAVLALVCATVSVGTAAAGRPDPVRWTPAPRGYAGHRLRTEICTDDSAFDALEHEWDALLDERDQGTYFLRPHWNRLWWRYYAPRGSRLRLVTCRTEDGRLVGVAPFYLEQRRVFGIPAARELRFLGTGIVLKTSESLDLATSPGLEAEVARAIAEQMHQDPEWDRMWLFQVPRGAPAMTHFARAMGDGMRTVECDRAPYIDTSVDWSTLKAAYGRSMRRNVEYYPRRLFRIYACEFRRVTARDEIDPAVDALVRLHQGRWQSKGEGGAFSVPHFEAFLRGAVHRSSESGHLRLWTLAIDGTVEAVLLGFLDHGVLHYFQKGFNTAFAKDDLGTALLALCVKACVEDPEVRAFDFMGGGAPYKDLWARSSTLNVVSEMARANWRTRLFDTRIRLSTVARTAYRAVTPTWLRRLRRERIRRTALTRVQRTVVSRPAAPPVPR